ncbi:MAG: 50S ribosomal protein L16 [Planctomycetes bacterium]|nr:50S ribosomal protein L16 [Planctomycetota bacterium]
MLMPKRIKYRKWQRGIRRGNAHRGNTIAFGDYALMSLEDVWLSAQQIEAGRVAASHAIGKEGRFWIRVFPHKPITGKPAEVRMGGGKGEPKFYAAEIKPGTVLFEISGVTENVARQIFNNIAHKMPVKTKMVKRFHTV